MLTAGKSTVDKIRAAKAVLDNAEHPEPDFAVIEGEVYDLRAERKTDDYTAVRVMFNAGVRWV